MISWINETRAEYYQDKADHEYAMRRKRRLERILEKELERMRSEQTQANMTAVKIQDGRHNIQSLLGLIPIERHNITSPLRNLVWSRCDVMFCEALGFFVIYWCGS